MKIYFIIISLTISYTQNLFDPYEVHTLDIQFYNPNYNQILQDRWEVDDKTYELTTIDFNGETMDSVGVRYKGNSTFFLTQATSSPKYPLNIDMDIIFEDQNLLGYNKVKLSNSIFDPTFVKESIGYISEGYYLPTSEVGYINISVNGEILGLYVSVESVNKPFLSKHFGNNDGAFFKCEPQFHFGGDYQYDAWPDLNWNGNDSTAYAYQMGYELKSETGWSELIDLISTLNFDIQNIETILNVDRVLWFFAASTLMPDLDTYNGLWIHNYYLYRNTSSGQFEIIPWDKDHTFGGALINTIIDFGGGVTDIYQWDPFLYENADDRPLIRQLMNIPLYKKIYTAHIRTIIDDIYNVEFFQNLAYGIQDVIEPIAQYDPNIFPPFIFGDYFQYNVDNYLVTWDGTHWCGITPTVAERLSYLLSHYEIAKTAPEIINVFQENINPGGGEEVVIQVEITGATNVELMATINSFPSHFSSIEMFDDGQHGDGSANDNLFAAVIPFQESGVHVKYYIRASNDDALVLNPQKAEREFYEYTVGTGENIVSVIVINEINYNSSDDFNTGDWVELYNVTSEVQDISNWVFKDENNTENTFTFPEDFVVNSNEYLILCSDLTLYQTLYPDQINYIAELEFAFSGSGETLRLIDSDGNLIDIVEYDDSDPWPVEPDGNGPTLELLDPLSDNSLAVNWVTSVGNGSPGSNNSNWDCEGMVGDLNGDSNINVLDVVLLVNIILEENYTGCQEILGDINYDNTLNILDVVLIVNIILES